MWASFLLGMPNWAKTAPRPMEKRPKDSKVFQDSRLHRFSQEAHTPSARVCSETRGRQYYLEWDSRDTTLAR